MHPEYELNPSEQEIFALLDRIVNSSTTSHPCVNTSFRVDDPRVAPLIPFFKKEFVLEGEEWPIKDWLHLFCFFNPEDQNLSHVMLGRIIYDPKTNDRVYLGVRASEGMALKSDSWPMYPVRDFIPPNRRGTNLVISYPNEWITRLVEELGIGLNYGS